MISNNSFLWRRRLALFIMTVITANVFTTHGQSYLLAIGQNPHTYFEREVIHQPNGNHSNSSAAVNKVHVALNEEQYDLNSTIFVIKKTVDSNPSELSQTAMDVITIVWYVATFLALAAFFLLMACSDRRCNAARRLQAARNHEMPLPPPTPSPSYSEFAPPSYESVMKLENAPTIYVIPFPFDEEKDNNNNNNNNNTEANGNGPPNSVVTFYTINELQKLGS